MAPAKRDAIASNGSEFNWTHMSARQRRIAKYLARGLSDEQIRSEIYQRTGISWRLGTVERVIRMLMNDSGSPTREALLEWISKNRPGGT